MHRKSRLPYARLPSNSRLQGPPWPSRPPGPTTRSAATVAVSAAIAAAASSPLARKRRLVPRLAPRARIDSRLFASTSRSPTATETLAEKRIAVRTKFAAGRACRSTFSGKVTCPSAIAVSEFVRTTCLLGRTGHLVQGAPCRGDHCRRNGALDQWSVDQPGVPVALALQDVTDREDRASEVAEHDHAVALVGPADRVSHQRVISAQ